MNENANESTSKKGKFKRKTFVTSGAEHPNSRYATVKGTRSNLAYYCDPSRSGGVYMHLYHGIPKLETSRIHGKTSYNNFGIERCYLD